MGLFPIFKRHKIALCLGGGGARGYAHIGALKAFAEEGLEFDMVAGTSAGSLIGGLYAAGVSIETMEKMGEALNPKNVHWGFTPNDPLKIGAIIRQTAGDIRIEDCSVPLYIVAVDLVSAKEIIIDKGLLYEAVSASCAVPGFFRPLVKGRLHLVDGGVLNNIPAGVCRMVGADNVVTVDINSSRGSGTEGLGLMEVVRASFSIMMAGTSHEGLINSDIIIAPDLSQFKATKKDGYEAMIELGYLAAKEKITDIKALMGKKDKKKR